MTVSEKISGSKTIHYVYFTSPHISNKTSNYKSPPHITNALVIVAYNPGTLGLPVSLDDAVSQLIFGFTDNTTITSKIKGNLNSIPAYKIEMEQLANPVNFTNTITKIPGHLIMYLALKSGFGYTIVFGTFGKNSKTDFIPIEKTMIDSFRYN